MFFLSFNELISDDRKVDQRLEDGEAYPRLVWADVDDDWKEGE